MLLPKDIINRIDEIVERSYIGFTFDIIGDDFFTEDQKRKIEALGLIIGRKSLIELLYILVRMRTNPKYRSDKTLNQLLDEVAQTGVLPAITDAQQDTIEHGKASINQSIEDSKKFIIKRIREEILDTNDSYRQEIQMTGITNLAEVQERANNSMQLLLGTLLGISVMANKNFTRAFSTSLTKFINNGVVDEVAAIAGKDAKNSLVFKNVVNDSSLCEWCRSFYMNPDGTPKIYRLKDLQKNGSNIGKPRSAWNPTVGPCHVRCRCQLQHLESTDEAS